MLLDENPGWIRAYRRGDREVSVALYAAYGDVVYRFLRGRLKGAADARDLAQEVFIVAFHEETRRRYSGTSPFERFLLGVAKNLLMHHLRAERIRSAGAEALARGLGAEDTEAPTVDHAIEEKEAATILEDFLAELPDRERDFFRRHMMERPARRITGERLGMTEDQIRYLECRLRDKALGYLKRIGWSLRDPAPRAQRKPRPRPNAQAPAMSGGRSPVFARCPHAVIRASI